ncbi:hypothetical protein SNE25_28705 [Mucilaginibacter sabulilitoris]|uniref:Uncharacterized protein n=1 Tax=Mucilaginibacter sabulilitoris TaxID=1173583 RepID=A0ABZ0TP89_9SPHI|nr:hypothetical protein [Mucilaginibacter sabulilitoris]WPU93305.1 hypothetical protein SNE25_28705 [Mucilaginibacter sabulilitoris]
MKNSIKLSALFLLLSLSAFATTPAKIKNDTVSAKNSIMLSSMLKDRGVYINVVKTEKCNPYVMIYDNERNILIKDFLPNKANAAKGYVFTNLDNGDYTIEVTANNEIVKKKVHVYKEYDQKAFFFID